MYSERLDLTDAAGERFRIKDILLSHPDIKVEMYKGVQPKYVYREDSSLSSAQAAAAKRLILDELLDGPAALSLTSDGSATVPPPPPNAWGLGVPAAVLAAAAPKKTPAPSIETAAAGAAATQTPMPLDTSETRAFEATPSFDNISSDRVLDPILNRSPGGSRVVGSPSKAQVDPAAASPPHPQMQSQQPPQLPFSSMGFSSGLGFVADLGVRTPASLEGEVARMQAELDSKTREALLWSQQYQIVSEQLRLSKESNNSLIQEKNAILEQYHALFAAYQKLRESTGSNEDINQLRMKLNSVELELESARKQLRGAPLGLQYAGAGTGSMPFGAGIPSQLPPKWDTGGWGGLGASTHVAEMAAAPSMSLPQVAQPQTMICALPGCGLPAPQICGNCREVGYCKREHQR
jgi:hypothetical protein